MPSFRSLLAISLLALGSIHNTATATPTPAPCVILPPGDYSIETVSFNVISSELLGVGSPNGVGNIIVMEKAPPQGQLGVWTLTKADQGGYHISNVELGRNVSTLHLVESNLFLAEVALAGSPATTYAIECAGGEEYVIKNVTADQVWTTIPGTQPGDSEQGVANIELLPADGSASQRFLFNPV